MDVAELRGLRKELRDAGVFEHCEVRSWLKLGVLLGGIAGCFAAMVVVGPWTAVLAIPVAAVLATSTAMLGHEGSHRSFSASPVRNLILVYVAFPLFSGLGFLYWRNKHDRLHHAHPNVEGLDPDIKPFPFVSSRGDHDRCGRGQRWFQRNCQRWAFWPMSLLMPIGMRRASIMYLVRYPREHGFTAAWCAEAACMLAHYAGWLLVPSLIWGPVIAVSVYLAMWALVGVMLALVFAPAHLGLPIVVERNHDWRHQVDTTRNLELPRVVSFFFIGLDYQVEHHLFPKIPHQRLPAAAAITADWCKRHGIPYQSVPYLHALASAASFIGDAWSREATDASAMRVKLLDVVG